MLLCKLHVSHSLDGGGLWETVQSHEVVQDIALRSIIRVLPLIKQKSSQLVTVTMTTNSA
jgi:hypothetical protein